MSDKHINITLHDLNKIAGGENINIMCVDGTWIHLMLSKKYTGELV